MNRKEAAELLPIIQAYAEGKEIEIFDKTMKMWKTAMLPHFDCDSNIYRIKPEREYRPFKDAEECWQEMQKHQPIGWTYDYTNNIWDSIARVTGSGIVYEEDMMCFEDVFNRVEFADGTPFGVKIKE